MLCVRKCSPRCSFVRPVYSALLRAFTGSDTAGGSSMRFLGPRISQDLRLQILSGARILRERELAC